MAPPGSDLCISEVASSADARTCSPSDGIGGLLVAPGLDVGGAPTFIILTAATVTVTSDSCTPWTASTQTLALTLCVLPPGRDEADITFSTPTSPNLQVRFAQPDRFDPDTTEPTTTPTTDDSLRSTPLEVLPEDPSGPFSYPERIDALDSNGAIVATITP